VSMKLVAPPLYVLSTQTLDKNRGVEVLTTGVLGCVAALADNGKQSVTRGPLITCMRCVGLEPATAFNALPLFC
jgi:hypothetical protein